MPKFSLKWLFVVIAFVAVLGGWYVDHRNLTKALKSVKDRKKRQDHTLRQLGIFFGPSFKAIEARDDGESFFASDGVLSDQLAYGLLFSGVPDIEFERVQLSPEAHEIMDHRYDGSFDGDKLYYHLSQEGIYQHPKGRVPIELKTKAGNATP